MRILVTGAHGFIGKNLTIRLGELDGFETFAFGRGQTIEEMRHLVGEADAVVHLAGENRPVDPAAFQEVNEELTAALCDAIRATGRSVPLIFTSSTQAEEDHPYGSSKRAGEQAIEALAQDISASCTIFRLPNVFGKWCRPDYNSVVATFCHNISRGLPIRVDDPAVQMRLVYIDDVVDTFLSVLRAPQAGLNRRTVTPEYGITVGELGEQIRAFPDSRKTLVSERVGKGLTRALYATYISYLPADAFAYEVPVFGDQRGVFVEMLKTPDCGQFSFFTAHPGVTRGGHYHHSKTEKFLVLKGKARFGFRNIMTDEYHVLHISGNPSVIVETIPGWSHDITNVGADEMIVMLWANEIFDRDRP